VTRSLFAPVAPEAKMNRRFRDIRDARAFTAARRLMDEVFAGFPDDDHSLAREFQMRDSGSRSSTNRGLFSFMIGSG
jgi:hypothetical protein